MRSRECRGRWVHHQPPLSERKGRRSHVGPMQQDDATLSRPPPRCQARRCRVLLPGRSPSPCRAPAYSASAARKDGRWRLSCAISEVNEAVVATYLAAPLPPDSRRAATAAQAARLSKSAVSRVVATLKDGLEAWRTRSVAARDVI